MRVCPRCGSIYAAQTAFCGIDGEKLVEQGNDPLIGKTVDRYRIDERLGTGAMGVVYRGSHTVLDREYAVKVLYGDFASDARLVARFRREAQAASKIQHENIVGVVDFGTAESGLSFLVMELVIGENLADVLEREAPLSPRRAAHIARSVAAGLGEAHRLGFVHRDLKPANVMLTKDANGEEIGKVMDFGVVGAIETDDSTKLTRTGTIVGTPLYMAPEQAQGDPATPASDLYALGVMLFEMLSGQPPFRGDSLRKVVMAHLTEAPPPLPPCSGLERLVPALLQKHQSRRPSRADQVVVEIDRILEGMTGEGPASDVFDALIADGLRQLGARGDSAVAAAASPHADTKIQPAVMHPSAGANPTRPLPRFPSAPRGGGGSPSRTQSPLPRSVSVPRDPSGAFPPLPPLPPLSGLPPIVPARPPVIESPFTGGPTHPMAVDMAASYPELSIERREQRRGRRLSFFLIAAGLLAVTFFWGRWYLGELERKKRPLPPASAEELSSGAAPPRSERSSGDKKSKDDPERTFAKLEAQLLRMLAARHLSVADLLRSKDTASAATQWQQERRRPGSADAGSATSELIELLRDDAVVARVLEEKLSHLGQSIEVLVAPAKEKKALRARQAELSAGIKDERDQARVRRWASAISELEARLVQKAPSGAAGAGPQP